jgi:hypothetical protein
MHRFKIAVVLLALLPPVQAAAQFFPPRAFSEKPDLNQFVEAWYSRQLSAMDEPSVWKAAARKDAEIYRFTWLRTFHPPYAFRLEVRADGTGSLVAKSASGAGGYDPGRLTLNKTIALDAKPVRQFTVALGKLGFWNHPTQDPAPPGFDGSRWVLEGVKGGRYHVVDRWTPDEGPYRKLLLDLVALAGISVEPIY